jgi:uncharacterized protein (DUF4415 family)
MKKKKKRKKDSRSSRRAEQPAEKRKLTSSSSAHVVDADALELDPPTKARLDRELAALAKAQGRKIDLSDTRELPVEEWRTMIHGMDAWLKTIHAGGMYKPVKQAVSMRLDADIVAWLKQSGPGYQTRANQILREKMVKELAD